MVGLDVNRLYALTFGLGAACVGAAKLEAVGRLAGGVAHDLNNLMMVAANIASQVSDAESAAQLDDVRNNFV